MYAAPALTLFQYAIYVNLIHLWSELQFTREHIYIGKGFSKNPLYPGV